MDMNDRNRPRGREKKIGEGTAHVGRYGSGPVSSQSSGSGNREQGTRRARTVGFSSGTLGMVLAIALFLFLRGGGPTSTPLEPEAPSIPAPYEPTLTEPSVTPDPTDPADHTVAESARGRYTKLVGGGKDTVTIMVYMCGTDLESKGGYASKDLQEMAAAELSDKVNLLVFTGGCKSWKTQGISNGKNQIFEVRNGRMKELWHSDKLAAMTEPGTLAGFIYWCKENYPADRYGLIFWDHGGGSVSGYGYDEAFPKAGSMTLDGIAEALSGGGCKFDFVGFDACLMATLETALVVERHADYLIASEETEPGCGWYYTNWLTELSRNTSMNTVDLGKRIADDFVSVCAQAAPRQQATLSLIDLAELSGTLPQSFRNFAVATNEAVRGENFQAVATARGNTKEFGAGNGIDQVDLIHLARNMSSREGSALASVLENAVKYNATSNNISNAYGVSIFFPYGKTGRVSAMAATYAKIGLDESYTECIRSFASLEVAGQSVYGGNSVELGSLFGALLGGGTPSQGSVGADAVSGILGMLLGGGTDRLADVGLTSESADFLDRELLEGSAEYIASLSFDPGRLTWSERGGQKVLTLTDEEWEVVSAIALNVFVDDGEGYIDLGLDDTVEYNDFGDLVGTFDGTWLTIDGRVVAYYVASEHWDDNGYEILGRVPAILNGERVDLILSFTSDDPYGKVLGASPVYGEDVTETQAKGLLPVEAGDELCFLCDYYNYDMELDSTWQLSETFTVSNNPFVIENLRLDSDKFIVTYRITDIYQNHYWMPAL